MCSGNPKAGVVEEGRAWYTLARQPHLTHWVPNQWWTLSYKTSRWHMRHDSQGCPLAFTWTWTHVHLHLPHSYMETHTYIYIHTCTRNKYSRCIVIHKWQLSNVLIFGFNTNNGVLSSLDTSQTLKVKHIMCASGFVSLWMFLAAYKTFPKIKIM